jgi:transposase InsO family protein
MFSDIWNACMSLFNRVKEAVKTWTKPVNVTLAVGAITDLSRSKTDLLVENTMLRQQLIVLKRSVKRPQFTNGDRTRLTLLARFTNFWQSALHIVQPDTILRWHRDMFERYWKHISKAKSREPFTPRETIALIKQMARENHLWGAEKIVGELLKLGITVGKPTVQKYMIQARRTTGGQSWSTFLRNHAREVWACDFTVTHDLVFRPIYTFVIIAHHSREIVHSAVTRHPTDAWVARQLREATPWNRKPCFLIRDNDKKVGQQFSAVAHSSGIKELLTPLKSPRANAICERFFSSLKRESLDHFLIFREAQLRRIVQEYVAYYNQHRPHQGIQQRIPIWFVNHRPPTSNRVQGKVIAMPILSGLHHSYAYAGAGH